MTELLDKRLLTIFEAIEQGIIVQADAQFMMEFIKAQARKVEELQEELRIQDEANDALTARAKEVKW